MEEEHEGAATGFDVMEADAVDLYEAVLGSLDPAGLRVAQLNLPLSWSSLEIYMGPFREEAREGLST